MSVIEIFHQPRADRNLCARVRFHQIQGPVTASAATAKLKIQAKIRVGQPKISPVWISWFQMRAYFSATGMARVLSNRSTSPL